VTIPPYRLEEQESEIDGTRVRPRIEDERKEKKERKRKPRRTLV
jgi:hypothetical protein